MNRLPRALQRLATVLSGAWSKETSYDPVGWSLRNTAWGQCAVTALIVQDLFGGELFCAKVKSGPWRGSDHYWNLLPNNLEVDLTRRQFRASAEFSPAVEVSRESVLSFSDTVQRYIRLRTLVQSRLTGRGLDSRFGSEANLNPNHRANSL